MKVLLALATGHTQSHAAREAKMGLSAVHNLWVIPDFQEDLLRVRDALKGTYVQDIIGQMVEDCLVPLADLDPKLGLAQAKNREMLLKSTGVLKDGAGAPKTKDMEDRNEERALEAVPVGELLSIGRGEKTTYEVMEAKIDSGEEEEEDGRSED